MNLPKVTVLLASYNGSQFIEQQIDSVLASTGVDVSLIVRDDRSTDDTAKKVRAYGERVTFIERDEADPQYGHLANFSALCDYALKHTHSDFYAFCDQDDVWLPEKLEVMVEAAKPKTGDASAPVLVHCDLEVVDARLNPLATSYWRYQGLPNPAAQRMNKLMYQNVVTGCASLFNRALLECATPVPGSAVVHDYWFGLVAEAIGQVIFIDRPLIKYRQHGANSIGSVAFEEQRSYFKKFLYQMLWRFPGNLAASQRQVDALLQRFGTQLADEQKKLLGDFAQFHRHGMLSRIRTGCRLLNTREKSWGEALYLRLVFALLSRIHARQESD